MWFTSCSLTTSGHVGAAWVKTCLCMYSMQSSTCSSLGGTEKCLSTVVDTFATIITAAGAFLK